MSEVFVPYGDSASDTATLLLAGQEKLEHPVHVVRSVEGGFMVPAEVADEAGLDYESDDDEQDDADDSADDTDEKPAPRKRAAKKTAAKTAAK